MLAEQDLERNQGNLQISKVDGGQFEHGRWWWYNIALPIMKTMESWVDLKQKVANKLGVEVERTAWLFDREGAWTKEFTMKRATEWKALDVHYPLAGEDFWSFYRDEKTKDVIDAIWVKYLLHHQALRNRFRIVKKLLKKNITELAASNLDEVRILSLASGSGRDAIDVLDDLKEKSLPEIKFFLVDLMNDPLEKAEELADKREVSEYIQCSREIIKPRRPEALEQMVGEFHPHIVYNIGFFDYWKDKAVVGMKQAIRRGLNKPGVFISGNIIANPEMEFLPKVIKWDAMYHRSPEEYARLVLDAGFPEVNVIVDPNEIFAVGEAHVNSLCR